MPKQSIRSILRHNVAKMRKSRGLSQERCAELADISVSLLQQVEHGRTWPSDETVEKLAKAFRIEPSVLYVDYIETIIKLLDVIIDQERRIRKPKVNKS